jgi:hypothetical protein
VNKEITFLWTPEFEVGLARLMLSYRIQLRPEGSIESEINFERRHARDFAQSLRTLMDASAPSLADDSDIAARMARLKTAHDGAQVREGARTKGAR